MRPHFVNRGRRLHRSSVMAGVTAVMAAVALLTAGCGGQTGAAVTSSPATGSSSPSPLSVPTSTPPRATASAHLARSVPVRLQVPAISVDSSLMALGLDADGALQVPPGGFPAGWFTGAPTPGELGPAIMVGHVDLKGPAVFFRLHSLKPGDKVIVTRADGSKPVFRVSRVDRFAKDRFPTKLVYGNLDHPGLRLITCGGVFNKATGHYEDNFVAFADFVAPAS